MAIFRDGPLNKLKKRSASKININVLPESDGCKKLDVNVSVPVVVNLTRREVLCCSHELCLLLAITLSASSLSSSTYKNHSFGKMTDHR